MKWSKKILFLSSSLPSASNIIASILLLYLMGVEKFGYYMIIRSLVQILAGINPGLNLSLLTIIPKLRKRNKNNLINKVLNLSLFYSIIFAVIMFCFLFVCIPFFENDQVLVYTIIFYWLGLYLQIYYSQIARAYENSKKILYSSIFDSIFVFLIILSVFLESFTFFIFMNGLRFFLKALFLYQHINLRYYPLYKNKKIVKIMFSMGFPMLIKSWLQTLQQYGDKFLFGVLYGKEVAAVIGIATLIGTPIIMYISSSATWILPLISRNYFSLKEIQIEYIKNLFVVTLLLVSSFIGIYIYDYFIRDIDEVLIINTLFLFICLNFLTIISTILYAYKKIIISLIINISSIIIVILLTYIFYYFELDLIFSLVINTLILILINFFSFIYFYKKIRI